jgi:hypothetical protein
VSGRGGSSRGIGGDEFLGDGRVEYSRFGLLQNSAGLIGFCVIVAWILIELFVFCDVLLCFELL